MQFIDQAARYNRKVVSVQQALREWRVSILAERGAEKLMDCFLPVLEVANAFDRSIAARMNFNALTTPEKLDLLIEELFPRFYVSEKLAQTGRDRWLVGMTIDGVHRRIVEIGQDGMKAVALEGQAVDVEIETDIVTLMAMLRGLIAEHHRRSEGRQDADAEARVSALKAASVDLYSAVSFGRERQRGRPRFGGKQRR